MLLGSSEILGRLALLHPAEIDLGLDRVYRLLARLGNPHHRLPRILHVAGTNGKGSTIAMLRSGFQAANEKVHSYISPHLVRFHERITLAGKPISEAELKALLIECEKANKGDPITFFEITTVAAFVAFSRTPADWLLLEVGMGGRLDATNVVNPQASIVTPVHYDHQSFLGTTLTAIAREKAGILKPGVSAFIGPQHPQALKVIQEQAQKMGCLLSVYGQDFLAAPLAGQLNYTDEKGDHLFPLPALLGQHQIENAATVIRVLRSFSYPDSVINAAMIKAQWPARLQKLTSGPLIKALPESYELWLDGGHNPDAGRVIAQYFRSTVSKKGPLVLVCGMLADKDCRNFFQHFQDVAEHVYTVNLQSEKEAFSSDLLALEAIQAGLKATVSHSVMEAVREARSGSLSSRILICGSLYLAGSILQDHH